MPPKEWHHWCLTLYQTFHWVTCGSLEEEGASFDVCSLSIPEPGSGCWSGAVLHPPSEEHSFSEICKSSSLDLAFSSLWEEQTLWTLQSSMLSDCPIPMYISWLCKGTQRCQSLKADFLQPDSSKLAWCTQVLACQRDPWNIPWWQEY